MRSNKKNYILFAILISAFIFCVAKIFVMSFAKGNIYSPYSSMRTDPVGTKVLYKSIKSLNFIMSERFFQPLSMIPRNENIVFFQIGRKPFNENISSKDMDRLNAFVNKGGRVIISYYPISRKKKAAKEKPDTEEKPEEQEKKEDSGDLVYLNKNWGFDYDENTVVKGKVSLTADEAINWHSSLFFKDFSKDFKPLYYLNEKPVVITKKMGKGSIVLISDSWFISNEAMKNDRHASLISYLIQDKTLVLFDEFYHGVYKKPGVATLIRRYSLHLFLLLMLLGWVLYIWRRLAILRTASAYSRNKENPILIKQNSWAVSELLKKNIKEKEILQFCIALWKKDNIQNFKIDKIEDTIKIYKDPVEGYNALAIKLKNYKQTGKK